MIQVIKSFQKSQKVESLMDIKVKLINLNINFIIINTFNNADKNFKFRKIILLNKN